MSANFEFSTAQFNPARMGLLQSLNLELIPPGVNLWRTTRLWSYF